MDSLNLLTPGVLTVLQENLSPEDVNNLRLAQNVESIDYPLTATVNYGENVGQGVEFVQMTDETFAEYQAIINQDTILKATEQRDYDILREFYQRNINLGEALLFAAEVGDSETLKFLLDLGVNPDYQDHKNFSALMMCVYSGSLDCVQTLFEYGAHPNLRNIYGNTALSIQNDLPVKSESVYSIIRQHGGIN